MINALKVALLAGVTLLAGHASAFIPWTNATFTQGQWDVFSGGSDNGYCGSPTLIASTLNFFPTQFTTSSSGIGSATITDRVVWETTNSAGSGFVFSSINVAENGTYSTTGTGQVSSTAVLTVTNLTAPAVFTTNLSVTYVAGNWIALGSVSITGWSTNDILRIEIFNTLTASTFALGDTATIDKSTIQRDLHGGLEVTVVPAPASLLTLIGALALRRRR